MSRKILPSILSIPILITLIFFTSVFLNGNHGFNVDKSKNGLWVSEITESQLNSVQTGDLIVAINSIPYSKILGQLVLQEKPSSTKTITVLRNDQHLTFPLTTVPYTLPSFLLIVWQHFLLIVLFLILAIIAITYATPSPRRRLFFLMICGFSSTIAATLVSHAGTMDPTLISMSFFCLAISNWFAFGAWIHFTWRFPAERDLLRNHPGAAAVFYLLPPAVAITGALIVAGTSVEFWPWLQRLRNLFLPPIILATFIKHTVDFIKLPPQPARNQIKLPLAAYWLSFGPYFFLYLLPSILFDRPIIHIRTIILAFLFLPIAYLVSLLRYRLFQVDRMISKSLTYIILITSFTGLYSLFLIVLKRWLWQDQILSEQFFFIFLIVVVALFNPLVYRLQKKIDRVMFGNQPISPLLFRKFSRQISTALDIPELTKAISHDMPKQFGIRCAAMLILDDREKHILSDQEILDPARWFNSELVNTLKKKKGYLRCNIIPSKPQLSRELEEISQAGYSMVLGLFGNKSLIGLLFIGPNTSGRLFTNEDTQFFATLANHTGIALENSLRYAALAKSKLQLEKLFEQLLQQKKMAAVGEMSTVLAHELKNPLAVINSSAHHLQKSSHPDEIIDEMTEFIINEIASINRILYRMVDHAENPSSDIQEIELQTTIPALINKWKFSADHHPEIQIECDIPSQITTLHADIDQLGQILLNLIRNSEEAMGEKGNITVSVREEEEMAVIRIADTGPGIPPNQINEIFKSFFSTKERGLGLGLPFCKKLIEAQHGTILVKNRRDTGAEVSIHLPFHSQS